MAKASVFSSITHRCIVFVFAQLLYLMHGYYTLSIYYYIYFFSLLSLVGLRFYHFFFFFLSLLLFPSLSLTPYSLSASTTHL